MLHDYEGIYVLDPDDLVNGEPSWNKEDVSDKEGAAKSIWYDKDWNNLHQETNYFSSMST